MKYYICELQCPQSTPVVDARWPDSKLVNTRAVSRLSISCFARIEEELEDPYLDNINPVDDHFQNRPIQLIFGRQVSNSAQSVRLPFVSLQILRR
jgi:hypothetical protein